MQFNAKEFFRRIDRIPGLTGAAVLYVDKNFTIVKLRPFAPICQVNKISVILKETHPIQFEAAVKADLESDRTTKLIGEAVGTVLNCSAAILSWAVIVGAKVAIPVTGGASIAVSGLVYSAAIATLAQCINSGYRVYNELNNSSENDEWDSNEWYSNEWYIATVQALDAISVVGAVVSLGATVQFVIRLRNITGKSFRKVLKGLNRNERKRLTEEIIKIKNPGISNGALKKLVRQGVQPKRYSQFQINYTVKNQLKDAIAATMSFTGSAISGNVKGIAVGIYQEIEEELEATKLPFDGVKERYQSTQSQ